MVEQLHPYPESIDGPEDIWEAYISETPAKQRSPQGAMAYAFGALTRASDSYFDMLWRWFTERRGADDMRANALDGGLSADDFKLMLDDHERNIMAPQPATDAQGVQDPFQTRVDPWLMTCFGLEIARNVLERNHRFLEEAIELVQANGCTVSEAHQIVDYVYGRDQGEINQEVGGVMVTLAALCLASGVDMHEAAETELARVWTKVEKIRAKHFAKPKFSPLPGYSVPSTKSGGAA